MQDGQEFEINGRVYIINSFEDYRIGCTKTRTVSWYWYSPEANLESPMFPTLLEALQSSIDTEHMKIVDERMDEERKREESIYGTHDEQAERFYRSICL